MNRGLIQRWLTGVAFVCIGCLMLFLMVKPLRITPASAESDSRQQLSSPAIVSVLDSNGALIVENGKTLERMPIVSGFATAANQQIRLRFSNDESEYKMTTSAAEEVEPGKFVWLYAFANADILDGGVYRFRATAYDPTLNIESEPSNSYRVTIFPINVYLPFYHNLFKTLFNGDFESGLDGWQAGDSNGYGVGVAQGQLTGQSALLGSAGFIADEQVPVGYGEIRKEVTVPLDNTVLNFEYLLVSYDVGFSVNKDQFYDTFEVYIGSVGDENSKTAERVALCADARKGLSVTPDAGTTGLIFCDHYAGEPAKVDPPNMVRNANGEIDLQNYAGENVTLIFRVYNRVDEYYNTYLYLDNLAWTASAAQ